jgi:nitrite reductase/ring-hydroxylating ferredoxin subunit
MLQLPAESGRLVFFGVIVVGWVRVANASDVPVGKMIQVLVEDETIALYHLEDGFRATSDVCTHAGESLTEGKLEGCIVACPKHGGKFNVVTGDATAFPCVVPIETYDVEIRDEHVWIDF